MPLPDVHKAAPKTKKPHDSDLDYWGLTHPGKVRETNQDHFMICSLHKHMHVHLSSLPNVDKLPLTGEAIAHLSVVADGVGGGSGGEEASRVAIETVAEYVQHSLRCYYNEDASQDAFLGQLQEAAMECHAHVVGTAEEDPENTGMATTLTLWLGVWPRFYVLQVGDSRCYVYRDGELKQLTRDQTMAQELFEQGVFTRTDLSTSHLSHVLSSSIGGSQTVPLVTCIEDSWQNVGMMCSDGLTKHVSDDQIAERMRTMTSAKQVCKQLLQDALDDGGTDNITIIVGRVAPEARDEK